MYIPAHDLPSWNFLPEFILKLINIPADFTVMWRHKPLMKFSNTWTYLMMKVRGFEEKEEKKKRLKDWWNLRIHQVFKDILSDQERKYHLDTVKKRRKRNKTRIYVDLIIIIHSFLLQFSFYPWPCYSSVSLFHQASCLHSFPIILQSYKFTAI